MEAYSPGSASDNGRNYAAQLVAERLTGEVAESYVSPAMARGSELEHEARLNYEFLTNAAVRQIGFVPHHSIADAGASPDGLVGEVGLVEIKVPNTATHIDTLLNSAVPGGYAKQMQWQMACTGRLWCDFVSYDPRLPAPMQLFIRRLERDPAVIAELEEAVVEFLEGVRTTVDKLRRAYALD